MAQMVQMGMEWLYNMLTLRNQTKLIYKFEYFNNN